MQTHVFIAQRLGAAALAVAGLIAAATAHADPGKDLIVASPQSLEPARQCTDVDAILAKIQYPKGSTFMLTDAGLVLIKLPKAVRARESAPEPEAWLNSGG